MINKVLYYVNGVNCNEDYFYNSFNYIMNINHFQFPQITHYLKILDKNNIVQVPFIRHNKYGTPQKTLISYQFERIIIKL